MHSYASAPGREVNKHGNKCSQWPTVPSILICKNRSQGSFHYLTKIRFQAQIMCKLQFAASTKIESFKIGLG